MAKTRGSISRYKSPKKSFGAHVKSGLKKVARTLKTGLSSATPESVQKPNKPATKTTTTNTGFKAGLQKATVKVVKGWHQGA